MAFVKSLLILVAGCSVLHCSTFIVAQSGDAIIVGTDSRSTLVMNDARIFPGPDTCKIRPCPRGGYFVIAANPIINVKTGIDFGHLATQACEAVSDPKSRADSFEVQAIEAASRILKEDKQTTVISVVFFGYDNGPYFFSRSIRVSPCETYREPLDCPQGCNKWAVGGYQEVIKRLAGQTFKEQSLEVAVGLLLNHEIAADRTGGIGAPLAILKIDRQGDHWVQPGVCHAGQQRNKGN